jgi:hypothetical protein
MQIQRICSFLFCVFGNIKLEKGAIIILRMNVHVKKKQQQQNPKSAIVYFFGMVWVKNELRIQY